MCFIVSYKRRWQQMNIANATPIPSQISKKYSVHLKRMFVIFHYLKNNSFWTCYLLSSTLTELIEKNVPLSKHQQVFLEWSKWSVSSKCVSQRTLLIKTSTVLADRRGRQHFLPKLIPLDTNRNICQSHNNANGRLIKLNCPKESVGLVGTYLHKLVFVNSVTN